VVQSWRDAGVDDGVDNAIIVIFSGHDFTKDVTHEVTTRVIQVDGNLTVTAATKGSHR
jgi:hypothetical protein